MIKFKKKQIIAMILAASLGLSLCSCGKKKEDKTTEATETISIENDKTTVENSNETEDELIEDDGDDGEVFNLLEDPTSPEAIAEQERFDTYLKESFEESVVADTITLHYTLADPEGYGITPPEVTFGDTDTSDEGMAEDKAETEEDLEELHGYDYDLLTYEQKYTYDILEQELETNLDFYNCNYYLYEPFAYTSGLQSNLPITMAEYTFYDSGDVDDYLKLLELMPDYFQAYLDFEQTKVDKGYFMNTNSANEVIRQCREFIAKPEENLLIETFNDNIYEVEGLTDEEIEAYKQANYDAVMNYIIPTYQNVIDFFTTNKRAGTNEYGVVNFEGGDEYYRYLIRSKVGTDKTPEEIIAMLDERLDMVMEEFTSIALGDYEAYMSYYDDVDNLYGDIDPKGTIEFFETDYQDMFPAIPAIDFTIEPVHESLVNIVSPAFFMTPPLDDYEHNSIYTNLTSDGAGNIWSTLAHEGVPGHMYQFVYFLSNDPEPIRTIMSFNGYEEGWATYAELTSYDRYTEYNHDVYADFERINTMLNLLVSARVEIGVNYEGWDTEATSNYLNENGFNGDAAQDLVDYVVAEPGNYQMYVTGWLEFQTLREEMQEALGNDFDDIEFHKAVLDAGPCQFELLDSRVKMMLLGK